MAGEGGNRRQYVLLALLGVLVVGYFTYGGPSVTVSGETIGDLPPIDIAAVVKGLKDVATVKPEIIGPPSQDSVPDRNLFQYGSKAPPPMTEAQRKAEELRLVQQEQELRAQQQAAQAEQAAEAERQRIAQEQQQQAQPPPVAEALPPVPVAPPKPVPPPINFRFVGVIGSPQKKVGVFMNGDKMILARKGEVIDGNFRVLNIGIETAGIGYTNPIFKDMRQTLDLGR